jgi:hypothetical protein
LARRERYWARFSRTEETKRVGSIFSSVWPASTTWPSCTAISATMPPSRLCSTCSWREGMTLPSPRVISSIWATAAQMMKIERTTMPLFSSTRARSGSCWIM